jgi:LysR family transcriptional regulator, glycine cleavage system transcriptional activator
LFERLPRRVRLTDGGERLFSSLHGALLEVAQSVDTLRPQRSAGHLTISTTPAFAALWLVPRLGRFYAAQPNIKLRLDTNCAVIDLHQDASVDLAIRYGFEPAGSLFGIRLFEEHFGVYGSPAQVARATQQKPTLISVHWHNSELYALGWQAWCEQAGEDWLQNAATIREYDDEHYALQAAIAGQGLVLASSILVSESLANGLLQPYRPQVSVPGAGYSVLCVPGRERHPSLKAFFDWLNRETG